jgi:polar amino acid transport system substrate-binding protein
MKGIALALLCATPAVAEPLRIGTEAGYAPYMFHDNAGALVGLDKDLGDALCASGGWDCMWVESQFDTLIPGLIAGDYDIVIAGMAVTPGRMALVDFTTPYVNTPENFGVFAGLTPGIDLDSARIAVLAGSSQESHLIKTGRNFTTCPAQIDCMNALVAGQVDLVFDTPTYLQTALDAGLTELQEIAREDFPSLGTAIAVRKHEGALRDRLNAGLAAMVADGSLQALIERWNPNAEE